MTGSTEERLRRALTQQAEATVTSPDAWDRIRARTGERPRRVRLMSAGWLVPACAAAVLVVVALTVVVATHRDSGDNGMQVTGTGARLYLSPTGLDARYRLAEAGTSDPAFEAPQPGSTVRVFGRRSPDGVTLSQSVVVSVTPGQFLDGTPPEPAALRVLGEDLVVRRDRYGRRGLAWQQEDGQTVSLLTFGLSDQELTAVAGSLRSGPALAATPTLPPGFVAVFSGQLPSGPIRSTFQRWETSDGASFEVGGMDVAGVTLDDVARELPGGHAVALRRTTGIFSDREDAVLEWVEAPNTLVMVSSATLHERELTDVAAHLRVIDEAAWQRLVTATQAVPGVGPGGPPAPISGDSFFSVRPVLGRTEPPCPPAGRAPGSTVIAGMQGGQEVACYEVGPDGLSADDVAGATASLDRGTGRWQVDFTLTGPGAAHFDSVARSMGPGRQLAIVLDGRLLSAPTLLTASPPMTGTVTGLDEQAARSLADRLGK